MTGTESANSRLLLSRQEAAQRLGVSVRTIDNWSREGRIKTTPLGRLVKVHTSEVERVEREGC